MARVLALMAMVMAATAAMMASGAPAQAQGGAPPAPGSCAIETTIDRDTGRDRVQLNFDATPGINYVAFINGQRQPGQAGDLDFFNNDSGNYRFQVAAEDSGQLSSRTNCGSIDLEGPVLKPQDCSIRESFGDIIVNWTPVNNPLTLRYIVRRTVDGNGPYWQARTSSTDSDWVDSRITTGRTYGYWLERHTAAGISRRVYCGAMVGGGGGVPIAPNSCRTFLADNTTAVITYIPTDNDNAERYLLFRSRNGGPTYWAGRMFAGQTPYFNNKNLIAGSSYRYSIVTVAADGTRSAPINCGTANLGGPPRRVDYCQVSATASAATVRLYRNPNDSASRFVLYRSRNGGALYWAGRVDAGQGTTITDGNVLSNYTYTYSIVTVGVDGTRTAPQGCGSVKI